MSAAAREELIARHARGRSFLDVGAMWSVDGALSFAAERAGASAVTALDVMAPTPAFLEAQRDSGVTFVHGDVHDETLGLKPHQVVWCSGVLYHVPHPLLTLQRLRELTSETLILATEIARGRSRHAVFAPGPGDHPNAPELLDPAEGFRGWWWLPTASAVRAMLDASGLRITAEHRTRHHLTVVAEHK